MRSSVITRELKKHDPMLYCERDANGVHCVYRKGHRFEHFEIDGFNVVNVRPAPHFIMALTHNWQSNGAPKDWGLEPLMARIKAMDLWNHDSLVDELIEDYERGKESDERALDNSIEAFVKDFRRQFAKTFDGVNTSTLEKKDNRRLRDGYR